MIGRWIQFQMVSDKGNAKIVNYCPLILAIGSHSKFRYTYARCLPPRPGALYSLILGIRDLSSTNNVSAHYTQSLKNNSHCLLSLGCYIIMQSPYSEINCNFIGIEGTPKGEAGDIEICLTFVCEHQLPNNWREDFDNIIIKFC